MNREKVLDRCERLHAEIEKAVNDLVNNFEKDHPDISVVVKTIFPKDEPNKRIEVCTWFTLT